MDSFGGEKDVLMLANINFLEILIRCISWDSPGGLVVKTPNAGGPGSIPSQGTRSYMHAATKKSTCHN